MEDTKEIYLSAMIPPEYLDDDDDKTNSDFVDDALTQYEFIDLIETIGTLNFKETYFNIIDSIKNQSIENQKILCNHIIDKVQEVYNFDFPEKININGLSDINQIYDFIKFLEFDNIELFINVLREYNVDFHIIDVKDFCLENRDKIINKIELHGKELIDPIFYNLVITLMNDILIEVIIKMIAKNSNVISNEIKIKNYLDKLNKEEI